MPGAIVEPTARCDENSRSLHKIVCKSIGIPVTLYFHKGDWAGFWPSPHELVFMPVEKFKIRSAALHGFGAEIAGVSFYCIIPVRLGDSVRRVMQRELRSGVSG